MHFLILNSSDLRLGLLVGQIGRASRLAFGCATDRDGRLARGTSELRLGCTCHAEALAVMVRAMMRP